MCSKLQYCRTLKYENYKGQTINDIFTSEQLNKAIVLEAFVLETSVLINQGGGRLALSPLPLAAQLAPVYAISVDDFDADARREAVRIANAAPYDGRIPLEVSGGVDMATLRGIAEDGVDCISIGGLTKHVHAIDFSLKLGPPPGG